MKDSNSTYSNALLEIVSCFTYILWRCDITSKIFFYGNDNITVAIEERNMTAGIAVNVKVNARGKITGNAVGYAKILKEKAVTDELDLSKYGDNYTEAAEQLLKAVEEIGKAMRKRVTDEDNQEG